MATENIMMDAVKTGGNRQELHEKIRKLSMEARTKRKGKRRRQQSSGADCGRPRLWSFSGGSEEDDGAFPLCRTRQRAGRDVPSARDSADS